MAEKKAEQEQEQEQVEVDNFVSDEEVQEHIDEGDSYMDEEPPAVIIEPEEEAEQEEDPVEDGGDGGGPEQFEEVEAPPAPMPEQWTEEHFEWGRYLNLSRDEVMNFAGGSRAFERMVGSVSSMAASEDPNSAWVGNPFEVDLGEDEEDEGLAKVNSHYGNAVAHLQQEIEQLKQVNHAMQGKEKQRLSKLSADEFDSICNTMDEELFGRGSYDDLGSEVAGNRKDLANAVSRLGHGYAARGEKVPSMRQLVDVAFGGTFSGNIKSQTIRKVSEKSRKRGSQTAAVPTHRDPDSLSAEQKAVQAAYEWQKEKGWI